MMKLLYTINSPYARKVRVVAAEKHVEIDMQAVVLADPACIVKQYNPLGKVPVLILDDGDCLYDSRVIVEYLDNRTPLAHLIPQNNGAKVNVRRWEALADGVCDAAVAIMLESRKPEAMQDGANITKQMDKVNRGLDVLNSELANKKWCVEETFSLADIALGCLLGYLDFRFKYLDVQNKYPNLAKHYAAMQKRASFLETAPAEPY